VRLDILRHHWGGSPVAGDRGADGFGRRVGLARSGLDLGHRPDEAAGAAIPPGLQRLQPPRGIGGPCFMGQRAEGLGPETGPGDAPVPVSVALAGLGADALFLSHHALYIGIHAQTVHYILAVAKFFCK
jgi:hypothetical protein